ncbi:2-hydroxyacid dehydrogenase [Lacticaseibacillus parahuelsenbergensis]|uniref:2-hydroxyacid dehydrogenase n=1 Tax=Lacticaseibacillus parahuelsenbergensis TaxID=3068305 RepID=A0ABY9L454_9LACO|nr:MULTISPECIES: 2-hydroxyacid dehydrogenase [Lacticaseibacillus]MDE3281497.1 2-hydroxyacid dehydrogenase [Lacticaseibacillus casei]WLV78415.1 2-hydroxyacid dehydrogenase [Lacticaseibacillus sp. NCIMB 15471]
MKILAFGDNLIDPEMLKNGLKSFEDRGDEIVIRDWSHPTTADLQRDNLKVEQEGPDSVKVDDALLKDIDSFDLIVTQFTPIGRKIIDSAKNLKYIGVLRGGIENVDKKYAESHNITVINTAGRNARAVAEFTVGLILAETRNIARTHAAMKKDVWLKDFPNKDNIPEVGGKTVGIAGLGHIGKLVGKFLEAMDAKIIFFDKYVDEYADFEKVDSLDTLIKRSDILTLHMRVTQETTHIIDKAKLAEMKPSAYLINAARAELVDEPALIEALKEKKIMGAALDTYMNEPLPADSPFLKLLNVTLTSHLAGSTADAFRNTPKLFAERFLEKYGK